MSVRGFQQAFCDLIASPQLCISLRAGGDRVLAEYDLSERERRRLEAVVRQPGMSVNCTLYRVNRVTPLYSMLPRSCTLLGESLTEAATTFWSVEETDMQFGPEAERFADFLKARLASGELRSPYLAEVLDFELAVNALRFVPRRRLLAERRSKAANGAWEVNPLLRVVRFAHEPGALLGELSQGRMPADRLERGDFYLALDTSDAELAISPLDARLGKLLAGVAPGTPIAPVDEADLLLLAETGMLVPA